MDAARDPIAALRELNADELVARIDALDAERKQLIVLLRSVRAREREEARAREAGRRAAPSGAA